MKSLLVIAMLASGCLHVNTQDCGGGAACPEGTVCTVDGGCASPGDVAACDGTAEGAPCNTGNGGAGLCEGGVCRTGLCGNGVLDMGEVCDGEDGVSIAAGETCSTDCRRIQVCGNGISDPGEPCDDGNTNPADGCDACVVTTWSATVAIGGSSLSATSVSLANPYGVAGDATGNVYIADTNAHRVRRVDPMGIITTVAGTGSLGYGGDGLAATAAQLNSPRAVAIDALGNLYIADTGNQRIRRVDSGGVITTVAGTTSAGYSGDGGDATGARLFAPTGVVVDGLGQLYIADSANNRIRRVDSAGVITTIAGTGAAGTSGDGGAAINAQLHAPSGVALDALGNVYVADTGNNRVRRINSDGIITSLAGNGAVGPGGDNGPAVNAQLNQPSGVAVDVFGSVFIADRVNGSVRRVDTSGTITTLAGSANSSPAGVAVDPLGDILIADAVNSRVRRVAHLTGVITVVAGTIAVGSSDDGGPATHALLGQPSGIALDGLGNLFISDTLYHRIRRVDPMGLITTVAGSGVAGFSGDGGPATSAQLNYPAGIAIDGVGNLYLADSSNNRIRRVDPMGRITTVAGTGVSGSGGDTGPATNAQLVGPNGVAVDALGNLYIADTGNSRIRRVAPNGVITTVSGSATNCSTPTRPCGDGGAATAAQLANPHGVAVDAAGNLFIADTFDQRIRRVDTAGVITTIAGSGVACSTQPCGDGGPATSAQLKFPLGVAVDALGKVEVADSSNHRIRRVAAGVITTIAGTGAPGFDGDGGAATSAKVDAPVSIATGANGDHYIADKNNSMIRRVDSTGGIRTVAGLVDPDGVGPLAQAHLADPRAFVVAPSFTLFAGGTSGTVEAALAAPSRLDAVIGRYPQYAAVGALARFRNQAFGTVSGIAYDDAAHVIYLSESSSNRLQVVTIVDPADATTWTIAPLANTAGVAGFADGAAASAQFRDPTGLYLDAAAHQLYVADTGNHVVRAIDLASATVRTVAGSPARLGYFGDGGTATSALLYAPQAITRCGNGDLFVADTGNERVRRIDGAGLITTVVGDGTAASSGEGHPARSFPSNAPLGLACDALGNLFVTSTTTVRLLPADASGVVDGSGGVQTIYGAPPRQFPASVTSCLTGIVVTDTTTIEIADACSGLLIELVRVPR